MLFLDGVYVHGANGSPARFQWVKAPTSDERRSRQLRKALLTPSISGLT
jgi:hypothetical protein